MFGTKSQKKAFFYTFPYHLLLCFCDQNQRAQHLFPSFLLFFISGHSMLYFSWFWFLNSSLIFMMQGFKRFAESAVSGIFQKQISSTITKCELGKSPKGKSTIEIFCSTCAKNRLLKEKCQFNVLSNFSCKHLRCLSGQPKEKSSFLHCGNVLSFIRRTIF